MKPAPNIKRALLAVVLAAGPVITGCASTPASSSVVHAAGELGTDGVPQAEVHRQLAGEQMKLAAKIAAKGDWEQAESMLKRAQVDAELALLLFQEEAEKSETMAAVERGRRLHKHNETQAEADKQSNDRDLP